MRHILLIMLAAAACGCMNHTQQAIDDDYHSGRISSADRTRLTQELAAKRTAERERAMQQHQQQPFDNPNYRELVGPQALEGDMHNRDGN
jgi:hypothetical protein